MTTPVQPGRRIVPVITQISATRTVGGEVGVIVGLTVGLEVGIRVGAAVSGQHCENMRNHNDALGGSPRSSKAIW
jgi:hypothetical protein